MTLGTDPRNANSSVSFPPGDYFSSSLCTDFITMNMAIVPSGGQRRRVLMDVSFQGKL